ncbi:MAG: 3-dehydroquinate synthase [Elusimicrobiota bacterium]|jgi:3-dehydroquinate synthase
MRHRSRTDAVFLVGFMASGKSSVGRVLARGLGRGFLDTDAMVAAVTGREVGKLIKTAGEAAFRLLEKRALSAAARTSGVVAVGGGAVEDPANVRVMRAAGRVVFLDAPLRVLRSRVRKQDGGASRPLWEDAAGLFKRRRSLYREASVLKVDADLGSPEKVADAIALRLGPVRRGLRAEAAPAAVPVRAPGGSYPVHIGSGLLSRLPRLLGSVLEAGQKKSCVVVTDERLAPGPGARLQSSLEAAGWKVAALTLPQGEKAKSFGALLRLYRCFLKNGTERRTPVVALGGGSVGDSAGFAAATFQRGLPLVHVPTTLLAQADSSVGGKTGVNLPLAKNAVGAFHQPALVVSDTDFLAGLTERDLRSGLAEVVKTALVFDRPFALGLRERWPGLLSRDPGLLAWAVRRCVELKARVVAEDERDLSGRRELLNFGHTGGHALEAAAGPGRLRHGEAVAWGMALAVRLSLGRGWMRDPRDRALAEDLLARLFPPAWPRGLKPEAFSASLSRDKKRRGGRNVFILLKALAKPVRVSDVGSDELKKAVAALARGKQREVAK